jgi:hypothetical protein
MKLAMRCRYCGRTIIKTRGNTVTIPPHSSPRSEQTCRGSNRESRPAVELKR